MLSYRSRKQRRYSVANLVVLGYPACLSREITEEAIVVIERLQTRGLSDGGSSGNHGVQEVGAMVAGNRSRGSLAM